MNDTNRSLLECVGSTKFTTILCDIPWPSSSKSGKRSNWLSTNTKPRYGTMKKSDILDLPVHQIAAPNSLLVMWATWMHLDFALRVMEHNGFKYSAGMPWLKVVRTGMEGLTNPNNIEISDIPIQGLRKKFKAIPAPIYGPGVWFQHCTELILIGHRGNVPNPRPARKGIIISPRQEHSRKPSELQDWIDAKFAPGPKIELFARYRRPGWVSWGNQLEDK